MSKMPFFALALSITLSASSFAVEAPTSHIYSWVDCIRLMTQNNAELRASRLTYESTLAKEKASRSGFMPSVSGELNYGKSDPSNRDGTYGASLGASLNLFNGLRDVSALRRTHAETLAAEINLIATKARLTFALKTSFMGFIFAKNYVEMTAESIKRRSENRRLVQLRFQAGRENKGSLLLSEASLADAQFNDLQSHNFYRVAKAQLARSLGLDEYEDLEVTGEIQIHPPVPPRSFRELAVETPDYRFAETQEVIADEGITAARGAFFPTLALNAGAGNSDRSFFPQDNGNWSVGLVLKVPLFDGGRDYFATRSASFNHSSVEATRINVSRDTLAKLENAYAAYKEGVASLNVAKLFLDALRLRAEIARKQYNNGMLSFVDWDNIENDYIARQKRYLETKRDRVLSEGLWDQALGKGVIP